MAPEADAMVIFPAFTVPRTVMVPADRPVAPLPKLRLSRKLVVTFPGTKLPVVLVLQLLAFEFDHLKGVTGFDFETGLVQYLAFVEFLVYEMDGNTRFFFFCSKNGVMHVIAIHAFTAVFG